MSGFNVFTYGSLMYPEIWTRIVRGEHAHAPAVADNFRRYAVRDRLYPGMIPASGAQVEGVVWMDVGRPDLAALDDFEGPDYGRETITLRVLNEAGGVSELQAEAFIYRATDHLEDVPWIPEHFKMQEFIETYRAKFAV